MLILAIFFLIASYYSGYLLTRRFFPSFDGLLVVASGIIVGLLISTWLVLLLSLIFYSITGQAIVLGLGISLVLLTCFIFHQRALFSKLPAYKWSHIVVFSALLLSCLLFFFIAF